MKGFSFDRRYYSSRGGTARPPAPIDEGMLRELVLSLYSDFNSRGYFEEAMGYVCYDGWRDHGTMGPDPKAYAFLRLRKSGLWPINEQGNYSETDLFDLIEFMHDHISKPTKTQYHSIDRSNHSEDWDRMAGQTEYREVVNTFLCDYRKGYELSVEGHVLEQGDFGLERLLTEKAPSADSKNVVEKMQAAILMFRRHGASLEDKRSAVVILAGILEHLRPDIQKVLTRKDEGDLFALANGFGLRHHNQDQKTEYDLAVFVPGMFYYYLTMIHMCLRLIERFNQAPAPFP